MTKGSDLEALQEHIFHSLRQQQKRNIDAPDTFHEFELRLGRMYRKDGKEFFNPQLYEKEFATAETYLRTRAWDHIEEVEFVQYKHKRRRIRIGANGAVLENIVKKQASEKTLVLRGFFHAVRLSLSGEAPENDIPVVDASWKKRRMKRMVFSRGALSFHLTTIKTRQGRELHLEIEITPKTTLVEHELLSLATELTHEVEVLESKL